MYQPTGLDIMWMVISLLTVDPSRQVEIFGGLPSETQADDTTLSENPAVYLLSAVYRFEDSWIDEFSPCPQAKKFFLLCRSMPIRQSLESFVNDTNWRELRLQARVVLQEVGLDAMPLPAKIEFDDYMEIVRSKDLIGFFDNSATERDDKLWVAAAKSFKRNANSKISCPACKKGNLQLIKTPNLNHENHVGKMICDTCRSSRMLPLDLQKMKPGKC